MKTFFKILDWFFSLCNKIIGIIIKYPFLFFAVIIIIIISMAILMFDKNANVGGLLGKLLGKNKNLIDKANSIPEDRKQALEEADKNGYVQHKVSELETSLNPFRDKAVITLPNKTKIKLPEGLKDTDIDLVIESQFEIQIIPNEQSHKKALEVQDLIKRSQNANSSASTLLQKLKEKQ